MFSPKLVVKKLMMLVPIRTEFRDCVQAYRISGFLYLLFLKRSGYVSIHNDCRNLPVVAVNRDRMYRII